MDLLKSYYDKKLKDYEVNVARNDDGSVQLQFTHRKFKQLGIILKNFRTDLDYERFLQEAIALRMMTDIKTVKSARNTWRKVVDFLEDKLNCKGVYSTLKTFLLGVFLLSALSGCSYLGSLSDFTGDNLRCSYQREAFLKCVLNDESEVLNEKIQEKN